MALSAVSSRAADGLHPAVTLAKPVNVPNLLDTLRSIGRRTKGCRVPDED